ncbi:MAG: hypothetical protein CVV49_08845 [Spirochaetae bacterium HGW-Spirochaetae-5]|nr:MAG: hypothetical protein CVV49_08845 [Spirochaetae bacterium HGW-Spirochaetae-5]
MFITMNPSTGIKSLNAAKDYINDMSVRASDMRPFLRSLDDDLVKEVQHEFDSSNPNKWKAISKAWENFKISEGAPRNIGVYSSSLMQAASVDAIKVYLPTGMIWKIAPVESIDFTRTRKIGITSQEWLRGLGRDIVNVILGKARNE